MRRLFSGIKACSLCITELQDDQFHDNKCIELIRGTNLEHEFISDSNEMKPVKIVFTMPNYIIHKSVIMNVTR